MAVNWSTNDEEDRRGCRGLVLGVILGALFWLVVGLSVGMAHGAAPVLHGQHTHALEVAGGVVEPDWVPVYYDPADGRLHAAGLPYTALPEVIPNGAHAQGGK